jgi:hypothetical protein
MKCDQRSGGGVHQCDPEQEARQHEVGARDRERARQRPQQNRERDEVRDLVDQQDREIVDAVGRAGAVRAAVDEPVDVLGNTLVGVVGLPGDETDPVVIMVREPARHEMVGQPAPPADHQHHLGEEFEHRHRDVDEGPGRKDEQELAPELRRIARLDGVEPVAIEEAQPQQDADLGLIEQHEKDHHRDRDAPLERGEAPERPDARLAGLLGVEVTVGDAHDLLDRRGMRHHAADNGEDRDRQRQRVGRQIVRIGGGPDAAPAGHDCQPENDGLDREDADENLEEARYPGGPIGRAGAQQRHDAKRQARYVPVDGGLHQREKTEQGDADAECFHGLFPSATAEFGSAPNTADRRK